MSFGMMLRVPHATVAVKKTAAAVRQAAFDLIKTPSLFHRSADSSQPRPPAIRLPQIVASARMLVCGFTPVLVGNTLESAM